MVARGPAPSAPARLARAAATWLSALRGRADGVLAGPGRRQVASSQPGVRTRPRARPEPVAHATQPAWRQRLARLSTLQVALLVSLVVHGGVLTLRLAAPATFDRIFDNTGLEVILVNARSDEPPQQVQAIAQATLAGGGDASAGRAASPLPPGAEVRMGDAPDDARRRLDAMQEAQMAMLAQLRREAALLNASPLERGDPSATAERERQRQILKQLAEIEKRINEENARPRKRYVSPATQEAVYAIYYDALRRRIEARGTRHYPEHQGRKLYGDLIMNITIDKRGQVVAADVIRSSGDRILDRQAAAIVRAAAPFGEFSLAMLREADQLVVTSRFRFSREEGLATTLTQ